MAAIRMRIVRRGLEDPDLRALLLDAVDELKIRYGSQAGSAVQDDAEYFVAYRDDAAVGCAGLQSVCTGVVELKRMFVPPSQRGRGIARAILAAIEVEVTRRGETALRLQTGTKQHEAIQLYVSAEYERVKCWGKYATDANAVCFEKHLT